MLLRIFYLRAMAKARIAASAALALCLASTGCSCNESLTDGGGGSGTGGQSNTGGQSASVTLEIEPAAIDAVYVLGVGADDATLTALATIDQASPVDVSAEAMWSSNRADIGSVNAGNLSFAGLGGEATITAKYQGVSATATLRVVLAGDIVMPGEDPTLPDQFDAGTPDPEAANAPSIEYPEDGVVLPGNLPAIEAQWSQASDNVAYRVRLGSPDLLDVAFYTSTRELLFPAAEWDAIRQTAPDVPITITVDALGPNGELRASAPRTLTVSRDRIDDSAIYVWQSSTGSFRVLDVAAGTDVPLPSNAGALGAGQPCSGCHRISRDGKRFAYSFNGAGFQIGTLAYDDVSQSFLEKVAPQAGVRGTYATFNPSEETTVPAMLLSVPDDVAQNTAGTTRLLLVDPDDNAAVASNLAARLGEIGLASTLMPDWAPDGSFVVLVAYDSATNFVRELGDDVVNASIVEIPVSFDGAAFDFGPPKTLVGAVPGPPDTAENNFLPTVSPDGSAVAFTRASGWWSIKTQVSTINTSGQIALVRRDDSSVVELVNGSNGAGTSLHSTWPQWAPTVGEKYMWLAYSSQRPYGHRLTPASPENAQCTLISGQNQCKQLWVTAIERASLDAGSGDPSRPPFWIPGQTLAAQYVSPQWTKAVLPPPR